ncbi:MAG: multifunctional oxoglutarate decarboxylase/oxoglutarate dehydrogenase thiamine pyrophosphate-binding subunit/dihydrolipoyllysine-residue succinyltransferase subunit [Thermoanaerobaculum sp.]|nr:multifunctional oxoglutarate decarboxylase/oxoglutarate dehydrogenase thiamine pyrophosphate-binding subunit/dihydrolipoyllysine-residue succinyltransferase subunit [Thermoanaerobaculum sp.]MDW7967354.1 multifunctional oxoglutarate decarboxylase/oxoglutarate dehydrogenase thiamine pyrophosphate-binding subunit/dihydrolipoyllysine-residue succinyltransferase subunit [Thermoanaerobaculum sp.]
MADRSAAFGPNVWLIDEMYREYLAHPDGVSDPWREFFSDYRPQGARSLQVAPAPVEEPTLQRETPPPGAVPLVGSLARLVENMEQSLALPTATSFRTVPIKLLEENRELINEYLARKLAGKVSFTHILAYAAVKALARVPAMRNTYAVYQGMPYRVVPDHVNLGIAVDVQRRDGTRTLLVPNIKAAERMDFPTFFAAYNEVLRKVRTNQLSPEDFAGTTMSLTNPGMLGTSQSLARLMPGQSFILATGSIDWPPEFHSADPRTLAQLGVSKVMTLACTYDHRVIQGAESGTYLGTIAALLAGEHNFYEEIFASLEIPYEPLRVVRDINPYLVARDNLIEKEAAVLQLIHTYRVRGHLIAAINPLSSEPRTHVELELTRHGLSIWDLDREFFTGGLGGKPRSTLREALRLLRGAYCHTVGVEYMHIQDPEQRAWIAQQVEQDPPPELPLETKKRTLQKLNEAEAFERFLHTKYIGHKRFSLEGGEVLIPMLDHLLAQAAELGVEEVVMGMAHRGRLNVLANILGMSYGKIFRQFEGDLDPNSREGTGDVKYHLGAKGVYTSPSGKQVMVELASNPSHLEAVDPVVEGMVRAKQDQRGDSERNRVMPVLIHGDAAFAGQGVVAETLNMSALSGFRTGGTVHIVVNNGIGFTTAPTDARSSVYATDVARMVQAPIFHVNGEDPEACLRVIALAVAFRMAFHKDVVVDLVCYRRWGHNEADEPAFTQPLMYAKIREKRSVRKLYTELLVNRGDITLQEAEQALEQFQRLLEQAFEETKESAPPPVEVVFRDPVPPEAAPPAPPLTRDTLQRVASCLATVPEGFHVHPKLARLLAYRGRCLEEGVDWGTAELLAFGTLLLEGIPVRLSGQDSRRGTFSQRHAVLVDQVTGQPYINLEHLPGSRAQFLIFDSLLSEYAVMAYEYGYSVARREALVLWEAQFGDFANGGQIVIDQFVSSAHEKWDQHARLTLLLPHGYEGQGPEHSSARMERFLQLAAGDSMRIAFPTTAANYFHLLRSQGHLPHPKPLVVFTPKSFLRADLAKSPGEAFTSQTFQPVLADPNPPARARVVVLCTGKVFFDLYPEREQQRAPVAILRLDQLYPFPEQALQAALAALPAEAEVRWVQEEPRNMGAWPFVKEHLPALLGDRPLKVVSRPPAGSPATGSAKLHEAEQAYLVGLALRT